MSGEDKASDGGDLVDLTYAEADGGEEYRQLLEEAQRTQECPFCPEHLEKRNKVIARTISWQMIESPFPYPNAEKHFLIIPICHLTDIIEVTPDDWVNIRALIRKARATWAPLDIGGGLAARFGTNSGVTIRHLHFHLIAPKTDPATGKVVPGKHVNFPIG